MTEGEWLFRPIARIKSDFPEKFGIPRQSGLVPELTARIVFEPEFRDVHALTGLSEFSHIWLLWQFSGAARTTWSPTVRPPKLGGDTHMGVFATRSPFRPNPIGLSCVKLEKIVRTQGEGTVLIVSGADLLDNTPIYDIKPYLPYADSHPEASGGFTDRIETDPLAVEFPDRLLMQLPEQKREAAIGILSQDPRPSYQNDPERRYGISFAGFDIGFCVKDKTVYVQDIRKLRKDQDQGDA